MPSEGIAADDVSQPNRPDEQPQTSGFYSTTRFEKVILAAVVLVSLLMHVPPLVDPNATILGQHWLFVTYPIGMVGVTTWWLAVNYLG